MNLHHLSRILPILVISMVLYSCASDPKPAPAAPGGSPSGDHSEVGFPAEVSLAALAKGKRDRERPESTTCPFRKGDAATSKIAFNQLVDEIKSEGALDRTLPLDDKQREEAFELVKSGQFKRDLLGSMKKVYGVNRDLPFSAIRDIKKNPDLLVKLPQAFARDLADDPLTIVASPACLSEFRRFLKPGPATPMQPGCRPQTLTHTLTLVYENPTASRVARTARIFTAKENRSMRLAIIAYARLNGINITDRDLDTLDAFLDTNKEPDLSPLIETGLQTFADQYGLRDLGEARDKIRSFDKTCSID